MNAEFQAALWASLAPELPPRLRAYVDGFLQNPPVERHPDPAVELLRAMIRAILCAHECMRQGSIGSDGWTGQQQHYLIVSADELLEKVMSAAGGGR